MAGPRRAPLGAALAGGAVVATLLAACGDAPSEGAQLTTPPQHYLLTVDDLVTPDFTAVEPAHSIDAATFAGPLGAARMARDGFQAAASVRFFRGVDLSVANGPVEIIDMAARFAGSSGAADCYSGGVAALDATHGAVPISTGVLGDAAHADSVTRTATSGVTAVQLTVEWRDGNVVNVLVVRGRYGGTRLDDALVLAHRVAARETA